jgi:hypothetical protein
MNHYFFVKMSTAPEATTILHIGAPKCGSTALQSALFLNREALKNQGIEYVSGREHWASAAQAVVGVADEISGRVPPISEWQSMVGLARRVTGEGRRALISSEWFASADEPRVERIVRDLGAESLSIVLTIRPLTSTLPSAWQQRLKFGSTIGLQAWLETVFFRPEEPLSKRVWLKHRYDAIARRWSEVVGPENVTVVVVDEKNRSGIFDDFSRIVGVPLGTLSVQPKRTNPSLSAFEADVLAELNAMFFAQGGTLREYRTGVYRTFDGYVNSVRQGEVQKSRIPSAMRSAVYERNNEIAQGLGAIGCAIVGDLEGFSSTPSFSPSTQSSEPDGAQRERDVRSAAGMMYSLMVTAGISEPATPLPGFGHRGARYRYQALSLLRRIRGAAVQAIRRRLRGGKGPRRKA